MDNLLKLTPALTRVWYTESGLSKRLMPSITTCNSIRRGLWAVRAFFLLCTCWLIAPGARADTIVFRNGQRLHVSTYQKLGDSVQVNLPGFSVMIPDDQIASIESEDVLPAIPASVPYAEQIRSAASKYRLDPKLIASVISVESNFNSQAVSSKSALGLMQLEPKTAVELSVWDVFDPKQNIDGGARYLRQLLDHYSQDLILALAAYNAGPDRVDRYRGVPPFQETHDYIRRVTQKLRANTATPGLDTVGSSLLPRP